MLEEVFWNYFESTGNIDAYMATKELDTNDEHESDCTYLENQQDYRNESPS